MRLINILFGLSVLVMSCRQPDNALDSNNPQPDIDSIRLSKALDKALQLASENMEADSISKAFEIAGGSASTVNTTLTISTPFDQGRYLIVRREAPVYCLDVYRIANNKFEKVIAHEQWAMTYVGDTIRDVNGDGKKDFLVNWYGASGCCLKNFMDVYLQREDGAFSEMFEFINPTFSNKEQTIRGVTYGHPGDAELYKYKWNDLGIDTIEFVYWEDPSNTKGPFVKSKYLRDDKRNDTKDQRILKSVPDEYRGIYGFDWFMNELSE